MTFSEVAITFLDGLMGARHPFPGMPGAGSFDEADALDLFERQDRGSDGIDNRVVNH